jgi:sec-independent protein translocase protein TatA
MGQIGLPELLLILVILMLVFGANRLPGVARGLGSAIRGFKEAAKDEDSKAIKRP